MIHPFYIFSSILVASNCYCEEVLCHQFNKSIFFSNNSFIIVLLLAAKFVEVYRSALLAVAARRWYRFASSTTSGAAACHGRPLERNVTIPCRQFDHCFFVALISHWLVEDESHHSVLISVFLLAFHEVFWNFRVQYFVLTCTWWIYN